MHKNALFKGRSTLVAMVTTAACSRPGASFSYKNVAKKEWNVYFSISSQRHHYKLAPLPYRATLFFFTLIRSIFLGSECEHTNRLFILVQFRSYLLSSKTGKCLSEFLQKYTDSGTESTQLAGYNIIVLKYVKNFWGPASTFYRSNSRTKLKIRYCIIWRCLHLIFSTTNVSDKWNMRGFERMLSYEQYPE